MNCAVGSKTGTARLPKAVIVPCRLGNGMIKVRQPCRRPKEAYVDLKEAKVGTTRVGGVEIARGARFSCLLTAQPRTPGPPGPVGGS